MNWIAFITGSSDGMGLLLIGLEELDALNTGSSDLAETRELCY